MPLPDYYALLEVESSASLAELKQAYYRQAKAYHPDLNGGDAEAENRFKQIAEAYRVLGDETERRLYDEAREREIRYSAAPELASMQRRTRFSVRRRAGRTEKPAPRRRFTILPPRRKMPRWVMLLMMLFWLSALVPMVLRTGSIALHRGDAEGKKEKVEPSAEIVRERLARMRADMEKAAAGGDARAQLRLGLLLYTGSAGVEIDRTAARVWWEKAAAQGNKSAEYYLQKCDFSAPAPAAADESEENP